MRSRSVAPSGFDRKPFECRLRFHRPLRGVELVPPDAAHTVPAARPEPAPPKPAAAVPPPAPPAPPPPAVTPTEPPAVDADRVRTADRERLESILRQVRAAVVDLRQDREGRLRDWQRAAIELALTIASRLLHERVVSGDFPIDSKVRDMIAQLDEDVPVAVRLNPADLKLLKERLGGDPLTPGRDDPRFIADASLDRGACQVEGRESMLLSDVTRELQDIRDDLLRSLNDARP